MNLSEEEIVRIVGEWAAWKASPTLPRAVGEAQARAFFRTIKHKYYTDGVAVGRALEARK